MDVDIRGFHHGNRPLTVEFGGADAAEYDLVIGADGIHSSVRALTFGSEAAARPVGQVGWRFVADCPTQVTTWSVMLGHRSAFLTLPIGDGHVYCYCDVIPSSPDPHDHLDRLFSVFAEPVPAILDTLPRWGSAHTSTIEEVTLDSWVRGCVVLVGDAAHATSPNMAEGAAMALEDGLVLADTLRRLGVSAAALSAFEARRRPRTDWVRAQTHHRDRTRYLPAAVRNANLRAFGPRIFRSNYRPLLAEA